MTYDPEVHHRRSLRLRGYDYTRAGAYFITVCTWQRMCLLGDIEEGVMRSNEYGFLVAACWDAIPDHFPAVELDAFVVMPNHVHGILLILDGVEATHVPPTGAVGNVRPGVEATHASPLHLNPAQPSRRGMRPRGPKSRSVGAVVGSFKSACAKRINQIRQTCGTPLWQRNYYDHIIRSQEDLGRIRKYILENPSRWTEDEENPLVVGGQL